MMNVLAEEAIVNTLPVNKRSDMYEDRAAFLRDVASYEMERLSSFYPAVRSPTENPPNDALRLRENQFEVEIVSGQYVRFIRIEPSSYIEGLSLVLRDTILSIPNKSNDVELWADELGSGRLNRVDVPYPYYMSETIITNRMYSAFVSETGYETVVLRHRTGWYVDGSAQWREGIANRYDQQPWPLSAPDHPVTLISWFDAMSFAAWLGRKSGVAIRIPTREEWILAARPENMRNTPCAFPWGNNFADIDRRMNFGTNELSGYKWIYEQYSDGYGYTSPVDAFPPNERGLLDMMGNVWVWNYTSMKACDASLSSDRIAVVPDLLDLGAQRNEVLTMQGGCYLARLTHAHLHSRMGHPALEGACDIGFRLVAISNDQTGAG